MPISQESGFEREKYPPRKKASQTKTAAARLSPAEATAAAARYFQTPSLPVARKSHEGGLQVAMYTIRTRSVHHPYTMPYASDAPLVA